MNTVKSVEDTLRRAFETALEEGFYPQDGTFADGRGGCCALGVFGVINKFSASNQYRRPAYAEALGLTADQVAAIILGFDGCADDTQPEWEPWVELGERLREDYFLCDGERP